MNRADFAGKRVVVLGGGISGIAAINLLTDLDSKVYFVDGNEKLDIADFKGKLSKPDAVDVFLGMLPEDKYDGVALAVISPGVPLDVPMVEAVAEKGVKIIGEVELAFICQKGRVAAITGTNGKTTTTSLVGEIFRAYYKDVRVVGNIGTPYSTQVLDSTDDTVYAAELSSFQLETAYTFDPRVSAILNITPDHLNRHHTMECYIEMKEKVTQNHRPDDTCVLNLEDEVLRAFGETLPCKVAFFSSKSVLENGYYYKEGVIYKATDGTAKTILPVKEQSLLGLHNYENIMAAIAITEAMGVPMEKILEAVKAFKAVEHRIEYTCTKRGVDFYNDSKGTNVDAAIMAIRAMDRPTHLIGGGYDKHCSFIPWLEEFGDKVKSLVLIGQTRDQIKAEAESLGIGNIFYAESLEEAVKLCYDRASEGEAVLLSPACASWGMFDNYEQRGRMFKDIARGLAE